MPAPDVGALGALAGGGAAALADGGAGAIDALRHAAARGGRRAAAAEVQVLFLTQLLRALRGTVPESDFLPRSPMRTVYDGVFDRSLATVLAAGDPLGLARLLGEDPGLKIPDDRADTAVGSQKAGPP
jgi:hypothetical protein